MFTHPIRLILLLGGIVACLILPTFADDFLDAVVEFDQPSGSHFTDQSHGRVLGEPDDRTLSIDIPETLVVAFIDNVVFDGPGFDLFVAELANGDSSVRIFGSENGIEFEFLLQTNGSEFIDLEDYKIQQLRYLRIEGLGNGGAAPGYDFDGAIALNSRDVPLGCDAGFHADSVLDFQQPDGSADDGQPIESVLGVPDAASVSIDTPEIMTVGFSSIRITDGPGPDLFVYEQTNLDSEVRILGSADGNNFELLAETTRSASIDLGQFGLESIKMLRFEGLGNGGAEPGYELDSIVAINFECEDSIPGDVNLDGNVDLLDVEPFIFQIVNGLFMPQADTNGDQAVTLLDVLSFVDLIAN